MTTLISIIIAVTLIVIVGIVCYFWGYMSEKKWGKDWLYMASDIDGRLKEIQDKQKKLEKYLKIEVYKEKIDEYRKIKKDK